MGETRATRLGNYVTGPAYGRCFRVDTSTTQAALDLSGYEFRFVSVTCFGAACCVLLAASNNTTTYAIDPAATSGDDQCGEIPVGGTMTFMVENGFEFLHYETASGTGYLRVVVTSPAEGTTP